MKKFFFSHNLQADEEKWQQILRVIDAKASYRDVRIEKKDLMRCVENFNNNVLELDPNELQVNYSHESYGEAAGWITELRCKGKYLEAKIRWTPKAKQKITDEEFRFFSAEYAPAWQDVEGKSEVFKNVLLGAALTNIPFVPGMKAVALSDEEGSGEKNFIFFKNDLEMKNFKKLLSALQAKQDVSLGEAEILKDQFSLIPEDERSELQADVDKVVELAKTNDVKLTEEKEELSKKLEDANKALELAQGAGDSVVTKLAAEVKELQKTGAEKQKELDKLKLDLRTKDIKEKVEELANTGKIFPKEIDSTIEMALSQGNEERQEKFLAYLSNMPAKVDFSELGSSSAEDATEDAKVTKVNKLADESFASDKSKTLAQWRAHYTRELE